MTQCCELVRLKEGRWHRYFVGGPIHHGTFENLIYVNCYGCGYATPVTAPPFPELYLELRCAGCDAPFLIERAPSDD